MSSYSHEVDQTDLGTTRIVDIPPVSEVTLEAGAALLRVDSFALTANNITYGVAGDIIGYWQFFPAEGSWGRIPVWGKGTVIAAGETGLSEGSEYYGYFPMSSYLQVRPENVSARGFVDGAEHRARLPPAYNQYSLMTADNGFDRRYDSHRMVYYPLFITGFVLDDYLFDNDFFGADKVILSSASSKTSISLAFMLKQRGAHSIGLTSAGNRAFVESLRLYNEVFTYDEIESLDAGSRAAYVDMAGNRSLLGKVHHHFGDNLVCSCGVGITHWESRDGEAPESLPGAQPAMFFAPSQIQKRNQDWGPEKFQATMNAAWDAFLGQVDHWITIHEGSGRDMLNEYYETVLRGAPPNAGYVVRL